MINLNDNIIKDIQNKGSEYGKNTILDGIINLELFYAAPIKILFILKESYDKCGNKISHSDDMNDLDFDEIYNGKGRKTERGVSSIISCLNQNFTYNKFCNIIQNKDKTDLEIKEKIVNDLKSIAWINVNKFPGQTSSKDFQIKKWYFFWKDILNKQIDSIKPDVIIFGRTFYCFEKDLKKQLGESLIGPLGGLPYYYKNMKNNRLLIDSFHPSFRGSTKEFKRDYIDNIVKIIKNNR